MLFSQILGLPHIKAHLTASADKGRIPHAQLFVGSFGSGMLSMAIAYAQYILCKNENGENNSGNTACNIRFSQLSHPDLHFTYPVATSEKIKKHPVSSHYIEEWRSFVSKHPYGNLFDWHQFLGIEKKQGQISVDEASEILKKLSLKSYEGGYKIMIIWAADKMNDACANKLLKLIEEPPSQTVFILITEDEEQIIQTIRSRCQVLHFPPLTESNIVDGLKIEKICNETTAAIIAKQANGDFNKALHILNNNAGDEQFEQWFITWVRSAFRAKGNKKVINDLIKWSESIAESGRETQKAFLLFCQEFFRQALLLNYGSTELVFFKPKADNFKLQKFAPFIHNANIFEINKEIENAIYHIERNGNAKIIFTDLSIKLTRLLHKKSN